MARVSFVRDIGGGQPTLLNCFFLAPVGLYTPWCISMCLMAALLRLVLKKSFGQLLFSLILLLRLVWWSGGGETVSVDGGWKSYLNPSREHRHNVTRLELGIMLPLPRSSSLSRRGGWPFLWICFTSFSLLWKFQTWNHTYGKLSYKVAKCSNLSLRMCFWLLGGNNNLLSQLEMRRRRRNEGFKFHLGDEIHIRQIPHSLPCHGGDIGPVGELV